MKLSFQWKPSFRGKGLCKNTGSKIVVSIFDISFERILVYFRVCVCVRDSVVSLCPHGLQPARLLCPKDFPGKNSGMGCHSLLQGIFPIQGSYPGLSHCRQILYCLSHQGSPLPTYSFLKVIKFKIVGKSSNFLNVII